MVVTSAIAMVLLTGVTVTTSGGLVAAVLGFFGVGAGLGLPALTDTVMAAVPERDAGVASDLNDVSRQLGGALGIAVIGSVVNDAYRNTLAGGVASRVAATLPPDAAETLTHAAHEAYVDAIARGFPLSAAVLVATLVVALTMLPRRMRATQAAEEGAAGDDVLAA